MTKKEEHIITFELDPVNPPPLTEKQLAALEALCQMPDSEIDYSDIPDGKEPYIYKAAKRLGE